MFNIFLLHWGKNFADWDTAFADQAYHQQVEVLAQQQVWSIDVVRLVEGCL